MKTSKISVVISAYNEEKKIKECLESASFADEIILVNSESTDKTLEIAKKYTDKIFTRPNNPMLNINKNFGFTKATGDWILSLDADERVTPQLQKEIELTLNRHSGTTRGIFDFPRNDSGVADAPQNDNTVVGYWLPRKNIIFNKWIQSDMWWPDYQLRLFCKGKGKFPEKHVHEKIVIDGKAEKLQEPLLHYNYETISQFIQKMDKIYTESEVKNILESGKVVTWVDAIRMPAEDFIKTYFAQKGFKDGLHGLVLSMLQAMYMEVIFAKCWERQGFKEEVVNLQMVTKECKKITKDSRYWLLTSFIKENKNPLAKFALRVKRKLAL